MTESLMSWQLEVKKENAELLGSFIVSFHSIPGNIEAGRSESWKSSD